MCGGLDGERKGEPCCLRMILFLPLHNPIHHQDLFLDKNLTTCTFLQAFQNKILAYAVKESTLDSLITELLLWLLDERVPHMDDGSQLLKALNVLMLKILVNIYPMMCLLFGLKKSIFVNLPSYVQDNADRTSSFVVLINLLRPLDPTRWPSPASAETFAIRNQKFSDLVVKCLIKLTKVIYLIFQCLMPSSC